ncbi:hypothetical protein RND81_11G040900 [Saponaria officinalis]|uniref:DUF3615 domain-containing protein n=1 Tax=Saponaria officinalis TaxID=3572 RepID=A0AAW1HGP2_SAPOF
MGYKGVKGMEQVIYDTQRLSFGNAPQGHLVRRDRFGADEIIHKLANTQLAENLSDSSSSNISGATTTAFESSCCPVESFGLDMEELQPTLWRELACAALEEYHNTRGIKLEIFVEVSSTVLFFGSFTCFHLDFEAYDDTGSTNKIFAEVFRYDNGDCKVNFCDIMDPNNPNLVNGCRQCSSLVLHPKGMTWPTG